MNVFLDMLGCRLNEAELQSWARGFATAGHRIVARAADAHVVVLNSCAVTGEAERKSRQIARRLRRESPGASLVLTGCFAELDAVRGAGPAARLGGVDLVVRNADKPRLVQLVLEHVVQGTDPAPMPPAIPGPRGRPHISRQARTRAFVKVQDGCRHRCTFCIVTVARGEERSRSIDEIVAEIGALGAAGHSEVVLTGVHLGGYGRDLGVDLRTLVRAILSRTSIPRVRLSSLEPWDLPEGFFELWGDRRLMPHLHLPLQSGCDSVLRRMGRRCRIGSFARLVDDARSAIDDLSVTTDVIVGFPGESDAEWRSGLETIRSVGFAHVHLFTYSPRQGTIAAQRTDQIAPATRRERMTEARALTDEMAREHRRRFVGSVRSVLWEEVLDSSPAADHSRTLRGHTDNYLRVRAAAPHGEIGRGRIEAARLVDLAEDGELLAERVAVSAPSA